MTKRILCSDVSNHSILLFLNNDNVFEELNLLIDSYPSSIILTLTKRQEKSNQWIFWIIQYYMDFYA